MTSVFSWQNSISLCPTLFCIPRPNLPVTPNFPRCFLTFYFCIPVPYNEKDIFFWVLVPEDLVGLHWKMKKSHLFAFSYCSWGSQGKNTEVVCHSLLQWTTFCQTSPPWSLCLGWPHMAWLSFIELDKAVVHVIRLARFPWLWFQSVLWCPLSAPTILLGFLLLVCGVFPHFFFFFNKKLSLTAS